MNRTAEQHTALNKWARYGTDSFVTKRGSGWIVTIAGYATPFVFKAREAARVSAEAQLRQFVTPA